jgi:hypothetical protein
MAVVFRTEPYPVQVWATYTDNILKLSHGEKRFPLLLDGNTAKCKFVNPRTDQLYGIWWVAPSPSRMPGRQ